MQRNNSALVVVTFFMACPETDTTRALTLSSSLSSSSSRPRPDTHAPFPYEYAEKMIFLMMYTAHSERRRAPDTHVECHVDLVDLFRARVCKVCVPAMKWSPGWEAYLPVKRHLRVALIDCISSGSFSLRFDRKGSESMWDGFGPGDAVVDVAVAPHPMFSIVDGISPHLSTTCRISLYEFYVGTRLFVQHLDGRSIEVTYRPSSPSSSASAFEENEALQGLAVVIPGEGLPYDLIREPMPGAGAGAGASSFPMQSSTERKFGDLYVHLEVMLPQFSERTVNNFAFKSALWGAFSGFTTKGLGQQRNDIEGITD